MKQPSSNWLDRFMKSPIRILHLITSLNTGGAEIALLRLLESMDRDKFEMQVVSMIPMGPIGEKIQALGVPATSLEMAPGSPGLGGLIRLIKILKQFQPAILQTWLYHADLLGLLAAKLSKTHVVIWNIRSAEMDFSQYSKLSGLVLQICAIFSNIPTTVVVNSQAGQILHTRLGYHPKQWRFIPNGIDVTRFTPEYNAGLMIRQEWNIGDNEILIGHVARIDPQKDHDTLLRAAAIVQKVDPGIHFVCVGTGPASYWNELKTLATKLGLTNLLWAGPRSDMPAIYNAMNILVSPSKGEGFPNVVAEAMACGIPCVVTDVGDSKILIGNSGICIPPENPEALAKSILKMRELSRSERIHLGEIARSRIVEHYSLDRMSGSYSNLYQEFS